jgi:ABC-type phosphate/phosphonate transport system substrate-binding protein
MTRLSARNSLAFVHFIRLSFILAALGSSCPLYGDNEPGSSDREIAYVGCLSHQFFNDRNKDAIIAIELLYKEIVGRFGYDAELVVLENPAEMLSSMRANKVNTVFANPIDYLELDSEINPDYRYTYTYDGSPERRIYLLTQAKDKITEITQLQGKRLAITDGDLLGNAHLEVFLAKAGLPGPQTFFSTMAVTTNSNAAIIDLFFNQADVAVTSDIAFSLATELNPLLKEKIEILAISDPYIPFVIGLGKQIPLDLLRATDDMLLHLKEDPKLNHILSFFNAVDIVKIRPEQLDTLRTLKREHEQLIPAR